MSSEADIRLLVGVARGGQDGNSDELIKKELTEIFKEINGNPFKVKVKLDQESDQKSSWKSQLQSTLDKLTSEGFGISVSKVDIKPSAIAGFKQQLEAVINTISIDNGVSITLNAKDLGEIKSSIEQAGTAADITAKKIATYKYELKELQSANREMQNSVKHLPQSNTDDEKQKLAEIQEQYKKYSIAIGTAKEAGVSGSEARIEAAKKEGEALEQLITEYRQMVGRVGRSSASISGDMKLNLDPKIDQGQIERFRSATSGILEVDASAYERIESTLKSMGGTINNIVTRWDESASAGSRLYTFLVKAKDETGNLINYTIRYNAATGEVLKTSGELNNNLEAARAKQQKQIESDYKAVVAAAESLAKAEKDLRGYNGDENGQAAEILRQTVEARKAALTTAQEQVKAYEGVADAEKYALETEQRLSEISRQNDLDAAKAAEKKAEAERKAAEQMAAEIEEMYRQRDKEQADTREREENLMLREEEKRAAAEAAEIDKESAKYLKDLEAAHKAVRDAINEELRARKEQMSYNGDPNSDVARQLQEEVNRRVAATEAAKQQAAAYEETASSLGVLRDTEKHEADVAQKLRLETAKAAEEMAKNLSKQVGSWSGKAASYSAELPANSDLTTQINAQVDALQKVQEKVQQTSFTSSEEIDKVKAEITGIVTELERLGNEADAQLKGKMVEGSKDYVSSMTELNNLIADTEKKLRDMSAAKYGKNAGNYQTISDEVQELRRYSEELKSGNVTQAEFTRKIAASKQVIAEQTREIEKGGNAHKSFGTQLKEAANQLSSYISLSRVIMAAVRECRQMINTAVELDTAMTQLKIVTNATSGEYEAFANNVMKSAREIGASAKDLIDSATVYARLGYSLDASENLSKYTAMLKNVADVDVDTAQNALTAIIKGFNVNADQAENIEAVLDKMVAVGNNFPISAAELAQGLNNAGSALAGAGNTLEQSMAMLTAANTTVEINAALTGNSQVNRKLKSVKPLRARAIPRVRLLCYATI